MVELAQTLAHLSPAAKELERLLLSRQLRHGNHPILSWCAGNVVVDVDANGNIRPSKRRSTERIDGISALVTRWPEWRQRRRFDLYTRIAELSRWHDRTHSHHTHHGGKHVAKGNPKVDRPQPVPPTSPTTPQPVSPSKAHGADPKTLPKNVNPPGKGGR